MSFSSAGIRADAGRQHKAGAFAGSSKLAHALTKATTLGISLLLVALWLALDDETAALKILLVYHMLPPDTLLLGRLVASLHYRQLHRKERRSTRKTKQETQSRD